MSEYKSHIADDLLIVLHNHLVDREYYINPNFLTHVYTAIEDYYNKTDDEVDKKISEMWGW